jgi:hypothetical protein
MSASHDALMEFLESITRFFMPLDIYVQIPHTPALDEIVLKIMMELLLTLALATKALKNGQLGESFLLDVIDALLNEAQLHLSQSLLETMKSKRYCRGLTASRKMRPGQRQQGFSKSCMVSYRI